MQDVGKMLQVVHKRTLTSKSITEKYKILKEVYKGDSCVSVAKKHNIPKQTLQTGLKRKKNQIYELVDSNSSTMKRQRCRGLLPYQKLRRYLLQVVSKCKRPKHSYSATMLKTNALFFAKELVCNDFRTSNGWLDRWKKRKNVSFKKFLGTLDMFLTLLTEYVHIQDWICSDCLLNIKIYGISFLYYHLDWQLCQ